MEILHFDQRPIPRGDDLDPRRRQLYSQAIWVASAEMKSSGSQLSSAIPASFYRSTSRSPTKDELGQFKTSVEHLRHSYPDSIFLATSHTFGMAFALSGIAFAFDPTDSVALFHLRRSKALAASEPLRAINSIRLFVRYRSFEKRIANSAGVFVTTGGVDEKYLKRLAPSGNILRVGNGTNLIHQAPVSPRDDGHTIGFHGGMTWEPNRQTALRLARRVAPLLNNGSQSPINLQIVGRPVPAALQALHEKHHVQVHGFVQNLVQWMSQLTLYVMPMYSGGGIKNKLIEALALGIPVITNTLGAEALDDEGRKAVAIADGDAALVSAIRSLLADPQRRAQMRSLGRRYAEQNFRWCDKRNRLRTEFFRLKKAGLL
jgi:glycosyltransferase involved in cell wall biosynthesis